MLRHQPISQEWSHSSQELSGNHEDVEKFQNPAETGNPAVVYELRENKRESASMIRKLASFVVLQVANLAVLILVTLFVTQLISIFLAMSGFLG